MEFAVAAVAVAAVLLASVAAWRTVVWWRRFARRHARHFQAASGAAAVLAVAWVALGNAAVPVFAIAAVVAAGGVLVARQIGGAAWAPTLRRGGDGGRVVDRWGREQLAYAFAARDKRTGVFTSHVKFGHTGQVEGAREMQVAEVEGQVLRVHEVVRLADGPGGEPRERDIHRRLAAWRYERSEWFEAAPSVLAEVERFERVTAAGDEFLAQMRESRR